MKAHSRPTWDEYFLAILDATAARATCDRGRSGCVITRNRHLLVTGYVGSPPGFPHCDDEGHLMVDGHCIRTVHAEQNALAQAAARGVPLQGATAYTTMVPCRTCAMLFVSVGIKRVVSRHAYQNESGWRIMARAGLRLTQLENGKVLYEP